jgi:hypothetical protein
MAPRSPKMGGEPKKPVDAKKPPEAGLTPGFSPRQLTIMGVAAILIIIGLIIYLFEHVSRLETLTARFLICLLVSLLLGVFFFVWWPGRYELDKIPVINLPVRVAGPVVLWLVLFNLLLYVMPKEDSPYRMFSLVNPPHGPIPYHRGITVVREGGLPADFELIEDRANVGRLAKILVRFGPGEEEFKASLNVPLHKPLSVVFRRSDSLIDVSHLVYSEE